MPAADGFQHPVLSVAAVRHPDSLFIAFSYRQISYHSFSLLARVYSGKY